MKAMKAMKEINHEDILVGSVVKVLPEEDFSYHNKCIIGKIVKINHQGSEYAYKIDFDFSKNVPIYKREIIKVFNKEEILNIFYKETKEAKGTK